MLKVYKSIKGKKELKNITLLTQVEYVNKTKTFFLKLITENVGQIVQIKSILTTFNRGNFDLLSKIFIF